MRFLQLLSCFKALEWLDDNLKRTMYRIDFLRVFYLKIFWFDRLDGNLNLKLSKLRNSTYLCCVKSKCFPGFLKSRTALLYWCFGLQIFIRNLKMSVSKKCKLALLTTFVKIGNFDSMLWMRLQTWQSSRRPEMIAVDLFQIKDGWIVSTVKAA